MLAVHKCISGTVYTTAADNAHSFASRSAFSGTQHSARLEANASA